MPIGKNELRTVMDGGNPYEDDLEPEAAALAEGDDSVSLPSVEMPGHRFVL